MSIDSLPLTTQVLAGFVFGFGVAVLNYLIANRKLCAWIASEPPIMHKPHIPTDVALRYIVRYGTNPVAIYLAYVFSGDPAVLIATGFGLLLMRNYSLVRQLTGGKEG